MGDILDHIKRHELLHNCLYELIADWMTHTYKMPSKSTVLELMQWSGKQTEKPTEAEGD